MGKNIGFVNGGEAKQMNVKLDAVFKVESSASPKKCSTLKRCIDFLQPGDILHVPSMRILGENLNALKKIVDRLIKKNVIIKFHKEDIIFNNKKQPLSMEALDLFNKTVEFERESIKRLIEQGVKPKGRNKKHISDQQLETAVKEISAGVPKTKIAKRLGISRQTLYNRLNDRAEMLEGQLS